MNAKIRLLLYNGYQPQRKFTNESKHLRFVTWWMQISIWNSVRINNKSCLKFSLIILLILFKFQLITISDIIIIWLNIFCILIISILLTTKISYTNVSYCTNEYYVTICLYKSAFIFACKFVVQFFWYLLENFYIKCYKIIKKLFVSK